MNKFNVHDVLRALLIVVLSLLAWYARDIHYQQVDISRRLTAVEKNQVKIMTVLGIEPYSLDPQNQQFLSCFAQQSSAAKHSKESNPTNYICFLLARVIYVVVFFCSLQNFCSAFYLKDRMMIKKLITILILCVMSLSLFGCSYSLDWELFPKEPPKVEKDNGKEIPVDK